jgi:hypothetical protein
MAQRPPFLTWLDSWESKRPVARVDVDFSVDATWKLPCAGSYHDSDLKAKFVFVNNATNQGALTITIGPNVFTVPQFTSQDYRIPYGTHEIQIFSSSAGQVPVNFYVINDYEGAAGANQFAIQQAVDQALASTIGQTVGPIINPQFDIWPDGTSFASGASVLYAAEGWCFQRNGGAAGMTVSRVNGSASRYALKAQRNAADAALNVNYVATQFLTSDSLPFVSKTVTISYDLTAGANFSAVGSTLTASIFVGAGVDQNLLSGFTGATLANSAAHVITATRTRYSVTANLSGAASQIGLRWEWAPVGVAGADDSFTIENVQIDVGSTGQAYRPVPVELEAARALYFYEVIGGFVTTEIFGLGVIVAGTQSQICMNYVPKRAVPGITMAAVGNFAVDEVTGTRAVTSFTLAAVSISRARVTVNHAAAGSGTGTGMFLRANATLAAIVQVNARM